MTHGPLRALVTPSPRARRRVAAVLASLAVGSVIVVACSSPDQPPLETSVGGGSSSGPTGGSSSGVVADDSGPGADGGGLDGTVVVDGAEPDADATTPTESGLTQAFDAAGFPMDANSIDAPQCFACSGCCDSTGTCQAGTANDVCGVGNSQCQDCTVDGGSCEPVHEGGVGGGVCR